MEENKFRHWLSGRVYSTYGPKTRAITINNYIAGIKRVEKRYGCTIEVLYVRDRFAATLAELQSDKTTVRRYRDLLDERMRRLL